MKERNTSFFGGDLSSSSSSSCSPRARPGRGLLEADGIGHGGVDELIERGGAEEPQHLVQFRLVGADVAAGKGVR